MLESAVIDPYLDEAVERDFKIMCLLCGKTTAQDVPAPADDNNFGYNIYAMIAGVGGPLWEKILGIVV